MSPSPSTQSRKPQHSTGPRTTAGKAASSRNALRHGLAAGRLLIPGEDATEWSALLADLLTEWSPTTPTEHLLVESMAKHQWLVDRALRLQSQALATAQPGELPPTFALLLRYQTTNERAFTRALNTLESMRKTRQQFVSQNEKHAVAAAQASVWASLSRPFPKLDYADYLEKKRAAVVSPSATPSEPPAATASSAASGS